MEPGAGGRVGSSGGSLAGKGGRGREQRFSLWNFVTCFALECRTTMPICTAIFGLT